METYDIHNTVHTCAVLYNSATFPMKDGTRPGDFHLIRIERILFVCSLYLFIAALNKYINFYIIKAFSYCDSHCKSEAEPNLCYVTCRCNFTLNPLCCFDSTIGNNVFLFLVTEPQLWMVCSWFRNGSTRKDMASKEEKEENIEKNGFNLLFDPIIVSAEMFPFHCFPVLYEC